MLEPQAHAVEERPLAGALPFPEERRPVARVAEWLRLARQVPQRVLRVAQYSPESHGWFWPKPEVASKSRYLKEIWKRAVVGPREPAMKYIGSFSESGGSVPPASGWVSVCKASRRTAMSTSMLDGRSASCSVTGPAAKAGMVAA